MGHEEEARNEEETRMDALMDKETGTTESSAMQEEMGNEEETRIER